MRLKSSGMGGGGGGADMGFQRHRVVVLTQFFPEM